MNSRTALSISTTVLCLVALGALIVVLISSLKPSASAGASLLRVDISELSEGSYLFVKESFDSSLWSELFLIKDHDSKLYIYRVRRSEEGVVMPDYRWSQWGGMCESFGPELTNNLLTPEGRITCHDDSLYEWGEREWNWTYSGVNLGLYTEDMQQLPFKVEGKYVVVGMLDS